MSGIINTQGADSGILGITSQPASYRPYTTAVGRVLQTSTNTNNATIETSASDGSANRVFFTGLETTMTPQDNNSTWIFQYMSGGGNASGTDSWSFHIDWKVTGGTYALVTCEGTDQLTYAYYAQSDPRRNKSVTAVIVNISHVEGTDLLFKPSVSSQHSGDIVYFAPPHVFTITEVKS